MVFSEHIDICASNTQHSFRNLLPKSSVTMQPATSALAKSNILSQNIKLFHALAPGMTQLQGSYINNYPYIKTIYSEQLLPINIFQSLLLELQQVTLRSLDH